MTFLWKKWLGQWNIEYIWLEKWQNIKLSYFFLQKMAFESQNSSAEIGQSINKGENEYEG